MSQIFNLIGVVVALVIVYRIAALYINRRYEVDSARNDVHAELTERCGKLEERVRVLERIVTDRNVDLDREFEELGD